jgi:3-oxoadipate enol-lactonase
LYECGWRSCIRLELNHHIQKCQRNNAPWIVLINGLFADLESYGLVAKYLEADFHILRYDCRGQGNSPKPEEIYSLDDHRSDLENLLNDLNIEKVCLIGLSNGGRIALSFAEQNPYQALCVVACDTYDKPSELLKLKLKSWLKAFEVGGAFHRFDVATPWIWGESVVQAKPELVESYRSQAANIEEHVLKGLVSGALEGEIEISSIQCPILFIVGREDVLTPPYIHEQMLGRAKNGKLKIVQGGHASLLEFPNTVKIDILPFLRSQMKESLK